MGCTQNGFSPMKIENKEICFYRTRAGDTALISDCTAVQGGITRGFDQVNAKQLVEALVGHDCYEIPLDAVGRFMSPRFDDATMPLEVSHLF